MKKTTTITKEQKKELYVNPDVFWELIQEFYTQTTDKWPKQLGIMIDKIANKMRWLANFKEYPYVDEMISDAKLKMLEILLEKKFNLYSYTPLMSNNVKKVNGAYHIREYKRGSDLRGKVDGGKNERGMIIFLPDGEFRLPNSELNSTNELVVEKRGKHIYDGKDLIYTLKDDDMKKYEVWEGLCLRTRNIAFGYFSQACKNCYIARIKIEQRNAQLKQDIMEKTWRELGDMGEGYELVRQPRGGIDDDDEGFFSYDY
jgi:hypothetical protein